MSSSPPDPRLEQLQHWLRRSAGLADFELAPASSDASFRRYFRVRFAGETRIVMDAPPEHGSSAPFVALARALGALGLHVPEVYQTDLEQGFLLLGDLGECPYLQELTAANVERMYGDALGALVILQARGPGAGELELPPYDRALLTRELGLFREWYLQRHLGVQLSASQAVVLEDAFEQLMQSALSQPVVCVHRDYHSRNLMRTEFNNPGILDFQDAVMGPVTYDLVSLLRDCYVQWPAQQVQDWALGYHELALQSGIMQDKDAEQFLRWFDWMGLQRHLKAIGIFVRLNERDGKPGYLADIPRTLGYVMDVCSRYPALQALHGLLTDLGAGQAVDDIGS